MSVTGNSENCSLRKEGNDKILIVEDEPDMARLYSYLFSDRFEIQLLRTGKSAIDHVANTRHTVDLVILDYKLPDLPGIEVLKVIKEARPSVPVIMITGYGNENIAVQAFRHGVREYIKKPFSYAELSKKVDFLLSLKSCDKKDHRRVLTDDIHQLTMNFLRSLTVSNNSFNIRKTLTYIDNNYREKIKLGAVADHACLSKYHFSRVFKKSTGISFQDCVSRLRIEKAKELMQNGGFTITEIAFSVGYSDLTHFGRMFKKITGITPLQFKKTLSD